MRLAIGIVPHTGWAACVVVGGSLEVPSFAANLRLELLGDPDRFVFHRAAEMDLRAARESVARATAAVEASARAALSALPAAHGCAIVARTTPMPKSLEDILAVHAKMHGAEGCFYRDGLKAAAEALGLSVTIVTPDSLDASDPALPAAGRVAGRPWTKDQKLAALAAWKLLEQQ